MRRDYSNTSQPPTPPLPAGCVFYAPLTQGDLTDHISGVTGQVQYNNSVVWDDNVGMYIFTKDSSYSPTQGAMIFNRTLTAQEVAQL